MQDQPELNLSNLIKRLKMIRNKKEALEEKELNKTAPRVVIPEIRTTVPLRRVKGERAEAEADEEDEEERIIKENLERKEILPTRKSISKEFEKLEDEKKEALSTIDMKYPLIPPRPRKGDTVFAWAHIKYNTEKLELSYEVIEPPLTPHLANIIEQVKEILKETIDIDFAELKNINARKYLVEKIREVVERYEFRLSVSDRQIVEYFVYRDFVGLGKVEPLLNDTRIEDISCDGVMLPLYVFHRDPLIGSIKTNVVFRKKDELDSFVTKLSQRCGRSISISEPLLDGALPDGSRVQATLGTDIARRGSNFTIRRFTEDPLTPIHMIAYNTLNSIMMAYLWMAVENNKSILIVGPTAAGKTSLLNVLSLFIRPELKIVSIEDTSELRLPHPHWVPEVARAGYGFGRSKAGEVTLDDLLKESLRQRPDYIIVGEVRGQEAYILFQQMSIGHPGLSTIHASSLKKVMDRLTTRPINLPPVLIETLDLLIFIKRVRHKNRYIRRVSEILELEGYSKKRKSPLVNKVFNWNPSTDKFDIPNNSSLITKIADETGSRVESIQNEIIRRMKVLEWMHEKNIKDYREVGRILASYYMNPEKVMNLVEEELY